jgi:tetratricopeptide (TPR) repeat protein
VHAADIPANPVDLAGPLARARTAYLSGRYAEADALYAAAIGLREGDGAREEPDAAGEAWLARPLYELGTVRKLEGRCEEASNLLRRSIRISSAAPNPDPAELSRAWEVLGTAFDCRARYQDSQHAYSQALNLEDGMAAPDPKRQVQILSGLAVAYQYLGRHTDSDRVFDRIQDLLKRARIDPFQHALLLNNLGTLRRRQGRLPEAEAAFREGLDVADKSPSPGESKALTAYLLSNLGVAILDRKAYQEAAPLLARSMALIDGGAEVAPEDVPQLMRNFATCLEKTGRKTDARRLLARATALERQFPTEPQRSAAVSVNELARGQ